MTRKYDDVLKDDKALSNLEIFAVSLLQNQKQ